MTWRYPCEEVGDCHGPMVSISHAELSFFVLSLSMKHEAWTNYADARVKHDYGQTSSVTEMMQSLHWRRLDQRRIDNKLSLMNKITHNLIAIPISDFLIPRVRHSRQYHPLSYRFFILFKSCISLGQPFARNCGLSHLGTVQPSNLPDWSRLTIGN